MLLDIYKKGEESKMFALAFFITSSVVFLSLLSFVFCSSGLLSFFFISISVDV